MAGKKVGDDGVGDLAEIGVKQADGAEILMVLQANNVVGLVSQFGHVDVGPTGTASTSLRGLRVRMARSAARVVAPVAMPSSTTMTVRSLSAGCARSPR